MMMTVLLLSTWQMALCCSCSKLQCKFCINGVGILCGRYDWRLVVHVLLIALRCLFEGTFMGG